MTNKIIKLLYIVNYQDKILIEKKIIKCVFYHVSLKSSVYTILSLINMICVLFSLNIL